MPRFTIELPEDVMRRLQACARAQRRTPKAQAEWLLIEALEAWACPERPYRGQLGAGAGSEYPAALSGSLENDIPAMVKALQDELSS